jgi:GNAT superfamily N-acetyltransferase
MTLDYSLLARLLYIPQQGVVPGRFTLLGGAHQSEHSYMCYYSHGDMRVLAVTEDRLAKYQQVFGADFSGTDAEVVEQVRAVESRQINDVGPIFLSLLDPSTFTLESQETVNGFLLVKLDETHIPALKALEAACKPIEWDHASLAYEDLSSAYGVLDGEKVAAVAHYLVFEGDIASIGVITHPDYRGKGLVTALSVRAIRHALGHGCHVIYRTMGWNTPAIQVALKLGFTVAGEYTVLRFGD